MTVSVKSLQKQLIAAVAMVLVAMIALGSSTYAWFASNNAVDATGLSITATSDTFYLLINNTGTPATGNDSIELSASATLLPAALEGADPATAANWYTAYSDNRTTGAINNETKVNLTDSNFNKYVLKRTVYLTLTANSKATGALTVYAPTFQDGIGGASKVAFAVGSAVKGTLTNATKDTPITLADSVTADGCVQVDIYYYFDGSSESVNSVAYEAGNLTTSNVALKFAVAAPAT